MNFRLLALALLALGSSSLVAAPPAEGSAADLAAKLSLQRQDPSTYVRLRMEIKPTAGAPTVLQVQIKERRTAQNTDLVYQVLWPKERKGESVLLRKAGSRSASGATFVPPDAPKAFDSSKLKDALLGSDLSYEDVVDDFFSWDQQSITGNETINRVPCIVLESKPGKGDHSSYASVRSWVDSKRLVPMRIEKYGSSGQLLRRIETTDVVKDGGRYIPAKLLVQNPRRDSVTELDGSRIKHDLGYTDQDFSPEGLKALNVPRSAD